jgi:hypothetical protein
MSPEEIPVRETRQHSLEHPPIHLFAAIYEKFLPMLAAFEA